MVQKYTTDGRLRAEEVYRRYAPRVFAYLLCHVPTRQDAEDLLVEVFIVVLGKLPSLDVDASRLAGYTQTVARNKVADLYRKRSKRQVVSLETVVETAYEPEGPAPELSVLTGERLEGLREAFNALPELQQTILRLRFVHGLRSSDIAAHLAKSENAVRVMLSRSLKFMRKYSSLDEERGEQ